MTPPKRTTICGNIISATITILTVTSTVNRNTGTYLVTVLETIVGSSNRTLLLFLRGNHTEARARSALRTQSLDVNDVKAHIRLPWGVVQMYDCRTLFLELQLVWSGNIGKAFGRMSALEPEDKTLYVG